MRAQKAGRDMDTEKTTAQAGNPIMRYLNVRRVPQVHPSLLALSALIATVAIYPPNARLYAVLLQDESRGRAFMLAALVTVALLGLVLASRGARLSKWGGLGRRACLAGAAAYVAGELGFLVSLLVPALPFAVAPLCGVLAGAALLPLTLAWIDRFSDDLRSVMVHGALVCAISSLLTWMGSSLEGLLLAAYLLMLSAVGAFAPAFLPIRTLLPQAPQACEGAPDEPTSPTFLGSLANLLSIIWLPLLGFLIFLFMTNAYEFPSDAMPVSTEITGALIASAITLAVSLLHYSTPLVIAVDKLVIPACAALCIVLGSFPAGSPVFMAGAASVYAPLIFMSIYVGASVVAVSKAGEFPVPYIVGVTVFCAGAVSMLGGLLWGAFQDQLNLGEAAWVLIVAYVAVIIVNLGYTSWRKECRPADEQAAEGAGKDEVDEAALRDQLLAKRVETLAAQNALTEREAQILSYLARGFTSSYIASCLLISSNTVRTHMYNMYRKLGVTSKAELLALVNE